jgi:hypothetical protein
MLWIKYKYNYILPYVFGVISWISGDLLLLTLQQFILVIFLRAAVGGIVLIVDPSCVHPMLLFYYDLT